MKNILSTIVVILFLSINTSAIAGTKNTIMVTAATGELGQGISDHLVQEGYGLLIAGRDVTKLEALKNRLHKKYQNAEIESVVIDFTDITTIEDTAKNLSGRYLKGIVLIGPRPGLPTNVIPTHEEWLKSFTKSFAAHIELVRLFNPNLATDSSVVIVSGHSSKYYVPTHANINVIRLALTGEVKNLAFILGKRNIRVNAISPAVILTEYNKEKIQSKAIKNDRTFAEQLNQDTQNVPLLSFGKIEDVAHLVSFLLSSKSKHISGSNISLDGGESVAY